MLQDKTEPFIFKGERKQLIEELKLKKGITDEKVLEVIGSIPRHLFFEMVGMYNFAYKDMAFPIGAGQTISQPSTVAFQTQLLQIKKYDKILEVGTGSGYQAAVLAEMGAKVFSIERQKELYLKTSSLLSRLGYSIQLFYGDGYKGLPNYGPFDKILITAAAPEIPVDLINQLKVNGVMVIPFGNTNEQQQMLRITKLNIEGELKKEFFGECAFVPMLKGVNNVK